MNENMFYQEKMLERLTAIENVQMEVSEIVNKINKHDRRK